MSQCIACGTTYSFTNTYKGNYCLPCQRAWLDAHPPTRSRPRNVGAGYRRRRRWGRAVDAPDDSTGAVDDSTGVLDVPTVDLPVVDPPTLSDADEHVEDDGGAAV